MDQTAALNALAPYLALVKSTHSEAATVKVIQDATSAPGTYIFTELLNTVQVQALKGGENGAYFLQLCRFYNGTLFEYVQDISRCGLPQLTPAQYTKLRELSLLSYARYPHNLTYPKLMELLFIKTIPELEEVVMAAIYNGLLHGRLDPHGQRVAVTSVAPLRDVPPSDIASLQDILKEWSERCTTTLGDLERQIQGIKEDAVKRKKGQNEWEEYYEGLVKGDNKGGKKGTARSTRGMKRGMFGMGGGSRVREEEEVDVEMMEEDDEGEMVASTSPRSSRSKRGKGFMGFGKKN